MPRSRIALETGMHSPWGGRLLSELGHEVIVAHARNVRLIGENPVGQSHRFAISRQMFIVMDKFVATNAKSDEIFFRVIARVTAERLVVHL
jgi:hypothetical protein